MSNLTETERLAKIAELLPSPHPEPGIADGMDLCVCKSGEVWPCSITQAAWLAQGVSMDDEMRKVRDKVNAQMRAEQDEYDALLEQDPTGEAARQYALRQLGW